MDIRVSQESKILLGIITSIRSNGDIISLINLVGGEVGSIGNGPKVRDEWGIDISDSSPVDSEEELEVSLVTDVDVVAYGMSLELFTGHSTFGLT